MQTDNQPTTVSKAMFWAGWVLSGLASAGLVMSAAMKFGQSEDVV